jgi:NAD(P)-dependent dehydrogenase (short-subunit alcohol dehydrogenase family)
VGRLDDRVAVVTGAGSGIGAACATRLAADGAVVATLDIAGDVDHRVDVRDEPAVAEVFAAVVAEHGRLDVLVNAAGVAGGGPVHLLDADEWDRVMDINLKGTFIVDKYAAVHMLEHGSGSIINIASIEGLEGTEGGTVYNASKGGVVILTKSMAIDYGRRGVRVNCICPGRTSSTQRAWSCTATRSRTGTCSAGSAPPRRSPRPPPSSPPTTPRSSPVTPWWSTEGSPPACGWACSTSWACERRSGIDLQRFRRFDVTHPSDVTHSSDRGAS